MIENPFQYRDNLLHVEDIPLPDIARKAGTPCYIYSANASSA
jgi:diaminopimelate decarboxylase